MRTSILLVVVASLAGPWAAAAPRLKDSSAAKPLSIVDEWVPDNGGRTHEFTEGGVLLLVGEKPSPRPPRYVVNSKTNPAEFDLTHPDKSATWLGICKVEGDTLTICISIRAGDARPTRFEPSNDPPISLQTFKRAKDRH